MSSRIETPEDIQWLKDTHLKGVPLPASFQDFQSAVLVGNEDAPDYVELYATKDPDFTDDYYHISFDCSPPFYCEGALHNGQTCKPYTGPAVTNLSRS